MDHWQITQTLRVNARDFSCHLILFSDKDSQSGRLRSSQPIRGSDAAA